MQIQVLFFGVVKDLFRRPMETLELPYGARVSDVLSHYARMDSRFEAMMPVVALSVNQEYSPVERALAPGDEVGILPPVSGGSPDRPPLPGQVFITREPIEPHVFLQSLKRPEDGAAVVFEGVVRNNTRGRRTLYLDYEAYEPMALQQMKELAAQAQGRFGVAGVSIVHRLGRMEIGETSVLIVVASAHRGPAFEASRWVIDTLKKIVPIWKKEFFEDGAVWADGEPFPDEIRRTGGATGQ